MINENHSCKNGIFKNDNEENLKNKHLIKHFKETLENLKRWLLIDSATTTSVGTNEDIFHSIELADDPTGMISNGGELDLNCTAEINNAGRRPFSEDGTANLFGMNTLASRGFCMCMDTDQENCIFAKKTQSENSSQVMAVHISMIHGMTIHVSKNKQ